MRVWAVVSLLLCLSLSVTEAQRSREGCNEAESPLHYKNARLVLLSPLQDSIVWSKAFGFFLATVRPPIDDLSLVNRAEWQINMTVMYTVDDTVLRTSGVLRRPAFNYVAGVPISVTDVTEGLGRELPAGDVTLELEVTHPIIEDKAAWTGRVKVEFNYQPDAPMPPHLAPVGVGRGLTLVHPEAVALPLPPHHPAPYGLRPAVWYLATACAKLNGGSCSLEQLIAVIQQCYGTDHHHHADRPPAFCPFTDLASPMDGTPACKFATNDVRRVMSHAATPGGACPLPDYVKKGEHPAGTAARQFQPFMTNVEAVTCPDNTPAQRAAGGQALRDKVLAEMKWTPPPPPPTGAPRPIPPLPSRVDLGPLLTREGKRVGIEVGVQKGRFLETLLLLWPTAEVVFAVDPWEPLDQDLHYIDGANRPTEWQDEAMKTTTRRLAPYGNVVFIRDYSPAVATRFDDGMFDFIYIDARHDYSSVLADLVAWWPKLKQDGIMAGHDFRDLAPGATTEIDPNDWSVQPDGTRHPQERSVRGAVLDFAEMVHRQISLTFEDRFSTTWMLRK